MHKYEAAVLTALKDGKTLSLDQLVDKSGLKRDSALWAIENLSKQGMINAVREERDTVELSDEGKGYAKSSLPEQELLERLEKGTIKVQALKEDREKLGMQWLKKKGYAEIKNGTIEITGAGATAMGEGVPEDRVLKDLYADPASYSRLLKKSKTELENLTRRNLLVIRKGSEMSKISATKSGLAALSAKPAIEGIDALDRQMILSGSWKGKQFKKYDIDVPVEPADAGRSHPLRSLINTIKDVYVSLGFKEMSGPIIEPAFWSFDSLFVPQDHPARTVMDTFYLSSPEKFDVDPDEVAKVKRAHEKAYHEKWSEAVASQAILRTHGTSVSARYLSEIVKALGKDKGSYQLPIKLFGISRVFRNENVDFKHLENFYQMDGIIIGERLTLSNLFDMLIKVYDSIGLKVKYVPAYFPFVEPGVEVQAEHNGQILEMGGAGMIRREIVGSPRKSLTVLAWGCGLERILLMRDSELTGIPELYNGNVGWARKKPLV